MQNATKYTAVVTTDRLSKASPEHVNYAAKTGFRLEMRKSTVFKPRARYQMI